MLLIAMAVVSAPAKLLSILLKSNTKIQGLRE
jgi:hypothetical protein